MRDALLENRRYRYRPAMTATQIIGKIVALPAEERAEVIRFARSLKADRLLKPDALTSLANRLARTEDSGEAKLLRDAMEAGFYGRPGNAARSLPEEPGQLQSRHSWKWPLRARDWTKRFTLPPQSSATNGQQAWRRSATATGLVSLLVKGPPTDCSSQSTR